LETSNKILDEIVNIMEEYPEYSLRISGHTDDVGDATKNQKLSEARAAACKTYLKGKGVDLNRMEDAGYGESKPKVKNDSAANRAENRRVEFELFVQ
jgi:outer membrane protein OmpA-like peptidoglycan-associated protein